MKTFGILYAELLETYRSDAGSTAFIGAINIFVSAIIGKYLYPKIKYDVFFFARYFFMYFPTISRKINTV